MKKIYTLLTAGLLTAGAASAAQIAPVDASLNAQLKANPAAVAKLQAETQKLVADAIAGKEVPGSQKRMWVSPQNEVWNAQFLKTSMTLNQFVGEEEVDEEGNPVLDEEGNPVIVEPPFEEFPFYIVTYLLWKYDNKTGSPTTQIVQYLEWPCMYFWDQVYNYTPEMLGPDNNIKPELRNYDCVPFEDFCNSTWQCKTFTESLYSGAQLGDYKAVTWYSLPTEFLGIGSLYNGQNATTTSPDVNASKVTFNSCDEAESVVNVTNQIYVTVGQTNTSFSNTYDGVSRIDGFVPRNYVSDMKEIHIFNTGVREEDSDFNPYNLDWESPSLQRFEVYGVGEFMTINMSKPGLPFDQNDITVNFNENIKEDDAISENVNYFTGAMYSNVDADPSESSWTQQTPEWVYYPALKIGINYIAPLAGRFCSASYNDDWASEDGVYAYYREYGYYPIENSRFAIGTENGSGLFLYDDYTNTLKMTTTKDIIYHYNPNNVSDVKTIPAVGKLGALEGSGVNAVITETNATVSAANGQINVVAGEAANVAVYTLNGNVVKNANLAAGQNLNVEVGKGLYIVKVGNKAVKVIL